MQGLWSIREPEGTPCVAADAEWAALAAQALANMVAYGSGDCVRCSRSRPAPGFRAGLLAAVSNIQVGHGAFLGFQLQNPQ